MTHPRNASALGPWFATRRQRFVVAVLLMIFAGIGASVIEHVESKAAAFGFASGAVILGGLVLLPWIMLPRRDEDSHPGSDA